MKYRKSLPEYFLGIHFISKILISSSCTFLTKEGRNYSVLLVVRCYLTGSGKIF